MGNQTLNKVILGRLVLGAALLALLAGCERELILQGERFPLRTDLEASIPVEGEPAPVAPPTYPENRSVPISLPAAAANADWTQRAGNARHQMPHGALSGQPQLVWSAGIGAGDSRKNRISAAPIVAGGRIYTIDAQSLLVATATSGARVWQQSLAPTFDREGGLSGGGLAYGDGRVFATTGAGELVALDAATGAIAWRQRLDAPVTGAPAVADGVVYVAGRDGSAWAVAAKDGTVRWQVPGAPALTGMVGTSAPAVGDRAVIFPQSNGDLMAVLKVGGIKVWATTVAGQRLGRAYGGVSDLTGDPVLAGSTILVGNSSGRTAALAASSGDRIWTADEGALGPVLSVGGSVFLVNDENRLVRLDAGTGEYIWSVEMPYFTKDKVKKRKAIYALFGPVLAGGRLAVASSDGTLRFFSPADGSLTGSAPLPGGAAAQPALAGGILYVVSGNGQLHAFR